MTHCPLMEQLSWPLLILLRADSRRRPSWRSARLNSISEAFIARWTLQCVLTLSSRFERLSRSPRIF